MADLPTVVTQAGLVPQAPADLHDQIVAAATVMSPGLTADLPGTLIEDIASTDTAALVLMDQARVETVDSVTPYGANDYLLSLLGNIYGVPASTAVNTSVGVVFSGPAGYLIPPGFQVGDGQYVYTAQDGGVVMSSGQSAALTCIAVIPGTWVVPSGTVTEIVTPIPDGVDLECSNPLPGVAGTPQQTSDVYRARVLRAGLASGLGMPAYVKTQLCNVPGVQPRLVSVQQQAGGGWKVLVGGGDAYAVARAILRGVLDISVLTGSSMTVVGITSEANGLVTTAMDHGYASGQVVTINGITQGMVGINGVPLTVAVVTNRSFRTGVATTLLGTYTSGGVLTPNFRNNRPVLTDYPDTYAVPFVSPPAQTVALVAAWNTTAAGYVNDGAVAQLAAPALVAYVNAVPVGQPLNLGEMERAFREAVASVLSGALLTRLAFSVSINGVGTAAPPGTEVVYGDPESYFVLGLADALVERG